VGAYLLVPVTATLLSGGAMRAVIGPPVAAASDALTGWLTGLGASAAVLLGAVLGAMMVADLGGPLNKAAYTFAITGVTGGGAVSARAASVMAAVMVAGMTAPLACWLATLLRPARFTPEEREQGKAAGVLGAVFISEGAIPFAAAHPLRVIPSLMLGGAAAGAATMVFGVTLGVPHGGLLALFAVGNVVGFIAALVIGVETGAAGLALSRRRREPADQVVSTIRPSGSPSIR
jgi:PTS system fructose-specific IIC component